MGPAAVVVDSLVKRFATKTAVAGLSFSVAAGEIYGLLGPNGAGKTTTLRVLAGIYQPCWVPTRLRDGRMVTAVTFVVDAAHCQYCGDLPIERAAHHIAFAEGRRGACRDYLANTAAHARALRINDPYIEELVQRVAALRDEYVIPTVLPNAEAVGEA